MKKYTVIANINIQHTFKAESEEDAMIKMENVELPKEYVEDSFEIVKAIELCASGHEQDEDGKPHFWEVHENGTDKVCRKCFLSARI